MIDPSERVAIVGIGGVFPGAPDPDRFWANIAAGIDATSAVPEGRWALDPAEAYDPTVATADKVYATRGGFLSDFRPDFEGLDLDPALVARLDPMFHLALHVGRAAWRDARTEGLNRSRVGVVLGNIVLPTETASALADEVLGRAFECAVLGVGGTKGEEVDRPTEPLNRYAAGLPAGLLAQGLGLGGGAYTLDAACASSLYALKLAADEVLSGRADAMLTGGLCRPDPLYTQMGFSQLRALSPDGRAYPFDGRAGGLVVGEGAGMFVLKRLSDALRQGDHIYGLVAAVGLSNDVDGGLLAPSSEGQLRAMRAAYEKAGWNPRELDLIECHATGTPIGDAVEFQSLNTLWGRHGEAPGRCVLGSHKANIGHTLTASGASGLLKVLLALKHRTLPPTANFATPGAKLDAEGGPFRFLTTAEPWNAPASGRPRRAAVSGFGFGGINAHALIEEWVPGAVRASPVAAIDPEREADPSPIAVIGLGVHCGPFRGLRAFQERVLGGAASRPPEPLGNDWGVSGDDPPVGHHLDALSLRLDRFRIPPKELEEMLPQQSLALLAAADAIADAGWDDRPRLRAGVILGIGLDPNSTNFHLRWTLPKKARAWNETLGLGLSDDALTRWIAALRDASGPPLTPNRTMGALGGLIASRVAREFRVGGPSFTVSSEETSGLRAVEIAVRLLRQGELDEAVVGAVDLTGDPRIAEAARRAEIGPLVRGDGAAALVLKRLDDAERDGDRVYAVIRGIGSASAAGIDSGAPSEHAVEAARQRAEQDAVEARNIGLFESTVTERLASVATPGLVGHTGAAEGTIGLVRSILALYQQVQPPSERAQVGSRFWLHDRAEGPRQAVLTALGVGGACHHVILESFDGAETPITALERLQPLGALPTALFAVEADDLAGLVRESEALESLAEGDREAPPETLARRWYGSRPNDPSRRLGLAIVASGPAELVERLQVARRQIEGPERASGRSSGVFFRREPLGPGGAVAFVFPGIGNHFAGMGRDLSARWPEVFRALDAETLRLRSQLAPGACWDRADLPDFADHRAPILGQVVLGTAVTDLLRLFGVLPDAAIGYSLGESSALFATRAWTERDAMHERVDSSPLFQYELAGACEAARRAWRLSPGEPTDWVAGIVPYSVAAIRAALAEISRAYLLIINTPNEAVVGGRRRSVERLVAALGGRFLPLSVVSTVHCEIARQVEDAYRDLHLLKTTPPERVRFYSTGWGRSYVPDRASAAEAIVAQALNTVDFPAVILRAYEDGVRVFVEIGPGSSCSRMIRATLGDRPHRALPACPAGEDAVAALLELLGRLIAERVPVDLKRLYGSDSQASDRASVQHAEPSRLRVVPVGGRPFRPPVPPAARQHSPEPHRMEDRPTVSDRPAPPFLATATRMGSPIESGNAQTTVEPLSRALASAEASRGRAHEAYLQSAGALAQTAANHMAFQMALVEALMAAPVELPRDDHVALDRAGCLEFAVGSIGNVLGPAFTAIDAYPTRVRLPDEPLMLVDRIISIEGEPLSMSSGRVVTEHDVLPGDWYLDCGKTPVCIAIESGQADLFLSGYLGADFETKGEAVYRLLDAVVVFHRGLPEPGDVIRYEIAISEFFRQGATWLFRFHFDATVHGEPLVTMSDGCAGFFSKEALAAGQGVVRRPLDLRPLPGTSPPGWTTPAPMSVESYDDVQVEALRRGELAAAFGPSFEGLELKEPSRLPGERMTLVHRVTHLDPTGGRHGLGLIRSELDIHPDDWFLTCHFIDDQVMPGTLMYECCLHTLRIFLTRMGWIGETGTVAYEPVPGVASRLRCRGQVLPSASKAVFELVVKEVGYRPEPFAIADALMYADGKAIVEVADMTVRLTGLSKERVDRLWASRRLDNPSPPFFSREQVLALAFGKPSEAFGAPYKAFDSGRFMARLPSPPYSFLDRVVTTDSTSFVMAAGGFAVAEYDVPADAWYFDAERARRMPFAVLQEVALQACGWLAVSMGSALTSDEDLFFRNLGGSATLHAEVSPTTGTLSTRVTSTRVSRSGGMIIQHYSFETRAAAQLVYSGDTYFGFFRREALADQVGIREATPYHPSAVEADRARSFDYPRNAPFPDDRLRMIDRVESFVADGGPHGLGAIVGTGDVDPSAWYFDAHFYMDPVCPGSLGLESFLQLLKVVGFERWGAEHSGPTSLAFQTLVPGDAHRWVYRGQIVPGDRRITVRAVVTAVDDARRRLKADGFLDVDGRLIYQMNDFTLRLA